MIKSGYKINPKTGRQIKIGGATDLKLTKNSPKRTKTPSPKTSLPKRTKTPSPKRESNIIDRIHFKGDVDKDNTGIVGTGTLPNGIEVVVIMFFNRKNPNKHSIKAQSGFFQATFFNDDSKDFFTIPKKLRKNGNYNVETNSFTVDRSSLIDLLNDVSIL